MTSSNSTVVMRFVRVPAEENALQCLRQRAFVRLTCDYPYSTSDQIPHHNMIHWRTLPHHSDNVKILHAAISIQDASPISPASCSLYFSILQALCLSSSFLSSMIARMCGGSLATGFLSRVSKSSRRYCSLGYGSALRNSRSDSEGESLNLSVYNSRSWIGPLITCLRAM